MTTQIRRELRMGFSGEEREVKEMTVAEYNVLMCEGETPADFDWDRYGELCEMGSDEEYIQTPDWEDLI